MRINQAGSIHPVKSPAPQRHCGRQADHPHRPAVDSLQRLRAVTSRPNIRKPPRGISGGSVNCVVSVDRIRARDIPRRSAQRDNRSFNPGGKHGSHSEAMGIHGRRSTRLNRSHVAELKGQADRPDGNDRQVSHDAGGHQHAEGRRCSGHGRRRTQSRGELFLGGGRRRHSGHL